MIEVIAGTNRPGSNTLKVANIVLGIYQKEDVDAQILNLQDLPQEIFDPSSYTTKPASFAPFQERILKADGLHIVVPEYNGSFPGVMKYFIDMLKFPESFEHHNVAFTGLGLGLWGNFRGVEQLQHIFGYRNAYNLPERVWISGVGQKLTEDGKLKDEKNQEQLNKQVKEFIAFVKRSKRNAKSA
ncbi:hypothetical protein BH09SUM1_BH09SUM1_26110 [soil metagenome]